MFTTRWVWFTGTKMTSWISARSWPFARCATRDSTPPPTQPPSVSNPPRTHHHAQARWLCFPMTPPSTRYTPKSGCPLRTKGKQSPTSCFPRHCQHRLEQSRRGAQKHQATPSAPSLTMQGTTQARVTVLDSHLFPPWLTHFCITLGSSTLGCSHSRKLCAPLLPFIFHPPGKYL